MNDGKLDISPGEGFSNIPKIALEVASSLSSFMARWMDGQQKMQDDPYSLTALMGIDVDYMKGCNGSVFFQLPISSKVIPSMYLRVTIELDRVDQNGDLTSDYEVIMCSDLLFTLPEFAKNFKIRQFDVDKLAQIITKDPKIGIAAIIPWFANTFVKDDASADTLYNLLKPHDEVFPPEEEEIFRKLVGEAAEEAKRKLDLRILFDALQMTPEQWDQVLEEQWLGTVTLLGKGGPVGALSYCIDDESLATKLPIVMGLGIEDGPNRKFEREDERDKSLVLELFGYHQAVYNNDSRSILNPNNIQPLVKSVIEIAPILNSIEEWLKYLSNRTF